MSFREFGRFDRTAYLSVFLAASGSAAVIALYALTRGFSWNIALIFLVTTSTSILLFARRREKLGTKSSNQADTAPRLVDNTADIVLIVCALSLPALSNYGAQPDDIVRSYGLGGSLDSPHSIERFLTYGFSHGSLKQIILNIISTMALSVALVNFGSKFRGYPVLILWSLTAAGFASVLLSPWPVVGFSGAVYGLLGMLTVVGMRERASLAPPFFYIYVMVFSKAVLLQLATSDLAVVAHLAGFLAGVVYGAADVTFASMVPDVAKIALNKIAWGIILISAALACHL
jgi:membrane associated rhomboid family serine protease